MTSAQPRADLPPLRIVAQRRDLRTHLREIAGHRELFTGLTHKQLTIRYKNSTLGFAWSMVQPLFLLAVYAFVFSLLGSALPSMPVWLMSGLLVWNFANTSITTGVTSVTSNARIVGKVLFPRAILPLTNVAAAAVHLVIQIGLFSVILAIVQHRVAWNYVWLLPIAVVAEVLIFSAVALLLGAANVYARDTGHLVTMLISAWFWLTPIIYPYARAANGFTSHGLPHDLMLINPVTPAVITFQRALYGVANNGSQALVPDASPLWYLRNLLLLIAIGLALLALALRVFDRAEANFADAL